MALLRVAALLLLCTAGSAKEDELSTGLKLKLEQMGADSMAKRAGVGGVAGFVGGYLAKYSQDVVLNACLLGGAAAGGACYLGYLGTDELLERVHEAVDSSSGYVEAAVSKLMGQRAAERVAKSRLALSKVAKSLPDLAGGAMFGALLGYRIG